MQDAHASFDLIDWPAAGEDVVAGARHLDAPGAAMIEPAPLSWRQRAAPPLALLAAAAAHAICLAALLAWTGDRLGDGVSQLDTITVSIETETPANASASEPAAAASAPATQQATEPPVETREPERADATPARAPEPEPRREAAVAPADAPVPAETREELPAPAQPALAEAVPPPPALSAPAAAASAMTTGALPQESAAPASAGVAREYARRVATALSRTRPRSTGVSGTVRLRFVVDERGRPADVTVAAPSGQASIDETALRALSRSDLPVPPPGMTTVQRTFEVPYFFR